jgi:hypothetical protein
MSHHFDCFPSENDGPTALVKAREAWEAQGSTAWPKGQFPHRKCTTPSCVNGEHVYPSHLSKTSFRVQAEKQKVWPFQKKDAARYDEANHLQRAVKDMTMEQLLARLEELTRGTP